ncbi:MAG: hypothetical protein M3457_17490 [Chloroflexota bacterium]|nr:hypothetical protein [Chloroflexota bacterium]
MNGYILHEYASQLEAPLRERAAHEAAQRDMALQGQHRPIAFQARLTFGQTLVAIGRAIQGSQGSPAQKLGNSANATT